MALDDPELRNFKKDCQDGLVMNSPYLIMALRRGLELSETVKLIGELSFGASYYEHMSFFDNFEKLKRDKADGGDENVRRLDGVINAQALARTASISMLSDAVIRAKAIEKGGQSTNQFWIHPSFWSTTEQLETVFVHSEAEIDAGMLASTWGDALERKPLEAKMGKAPARYEVIIYGEFSNIISVVRSYQLERIMEYQGEPPQLVEWFEFMAAAWREMYRLQVEKTPPEGRGIPKQKQIKEAIESYAYANEWRVPSASTVYKYTRKIDKQANSMVGDHPMNEPII